MEVTLSRANMVGLCLTPPISELIFPVFLTSPLCFAHFFIDPPPHNGLHCFADHNGIIHRFAGHDNDGM